MDIPTHDELLSTIDAFLGRHPAIGEARFGRDATGEPGLVDRLRKGSSPTLKILNRIKSYMAEKDNAADDAAPVHDGGDTTCCDAASSGKADEVSAPAVAA
jgi:hypothetical protein